MLFRSNAGKQLLYFKWPDPAYSCEGIKELFSSIQTAGNEIRKELASVAAAEAADMSDSDEGGKR